jgi:hypothetical protein
MTEFLIGLGVVAAMTGIILMWLLWYIVAKDLITKPTKEKIDLLRRGEDGMADLEAQDFDVFGKGKI